MWTKYKEWTLTLIQKEIFQLWYVNHVDKRIWIINFFNLDTGQPLATEVSDWKI